MRKKRHKPLTWPRLWLTFWNSQRIWMVPMIPPSWDWLIMTAVPSCRAWLPLPVGSSDQMAGTPTLYPLPLPPLGTPPVTLPPLVPRGDPLCDPTFTPLASLSRTPVALLLILLEMLLHPSSIHTPVVVVVAPCCTPPLPL